MFSFIKQHKIATGLISLNVVMIIAIIIAILLHQAKTATIDIRVAPAEATISLNDNQYNNFESHEIFPGNYHVKISMDKMQTKEYDISLENDGYAKIWDYLLDDNGSFDYYISHPSDELILSEIAKEDDQSAQAFIEKYKKKIAILNILPINYDAYTDNFAFYTQYHIKNDDSVENCPKIACLIIEDNTGGNEQRALDRIKESGFNPDDYEIKYEFLPNSTAGMSHE